MNVQEPEFSPSSLLPFYVDHLSYTFGRILISPLTQNQCVSCGRTFSGASGLARHIVEA